MSSIQYKYHPDKSFYNNSTIFRWSTKGGVELGPDYILKAGFQNKLNL